MIRSLEDFKNAFLRREIKSEKHHRVETDLGLFLFPPLLTWLEWILYSPVTHRIECGTYWYKTWV